MNQQQRRFGFLSLVVIGMALAPLGCGEKREHGEHQTQMEHTAVVTVVSIDVPNRLVTVRDAHSKSFTVYVDESHKAFPQASVGDKVRIRYTETLGLQLKKPGEAATPLSLTEQTARPEAGKPSGKTVTEVSASVKIEEVKKDGSSVTFTGPRGRRTLQVSNTSVRDYIKTLRPGDNVEVTYREALALSLEKVR